MRRLAVLLLLVLAGCTPVPDGHHRPTPPPTASPSLPPGVVIADGHGWTPAGGLEGPVPAPGACHIEHAANGEPLPDPHCTPGAVDLAVSDTNIGSTVCRKGGYTSSVRPPVSLTGPMKLRLLAAYGIPTSQASQYELDHLVALNDGGASDVRNLFPEPNNDLGLYKRNTYVHNDKDAIEEYTYQAICADKVSITAVQAAMAHDWSTAVATLGLPPIPAN